MSSLRKHQNAQLGFDGLLASAEAENQTRQIARESAHLPGTMDEALPFYRALIERHHAAMLAADTEQVMQLRDEAHRLAVKLNNYEPGICADDDSPGCVLDQETRAADGSVPLWGQSGSFEITCKGMRVRIEMDGMFGIGAHYIPWLGFAARAIDFDKPFLSETGFRSFLAPSGELVPGLTPDAFAVELIAAHVAKDCKGKILTIKPEYRRMPEAAS